MDVLVANPVVKSFLAGSISGTCSTILFQPLDLIKTRIQNSHLNQALVSDGPICASRPTMYSTLRLVLATENVSGLWKGMTPSITRTVPGVGLYFASLHALKSSFGGSTEKPGPLHAICLGLFMLSHVFVYVLGGNSKRVHFFAYAESCFCSWFRREILKTVQLRLFKTPFFLRWFWAENSKNQAGNSKL